MNTINFLIFPIFVTIILSGCTSSISNPGGIDTQGDERFCEVDTDCTSVAFNCGCSCGDPINVENAPKYREICENYIGPVCAIACEPTRPVCINNKCELVDYGPNQ